ncbi:hypothetical protein EYV94_02500 [Puteibacter caeruleilacunae]|nr:hypothetical protein EYV94_02500 [Puteibacter caeruleilacunae]
MKRIIITLALISIIGLTFAQDKKCKCFDGIGSSAGDQPSLTIKFKNGINLAVCGYEIEMRSDTEVVISEFNVFNCKTGKSVVEYGAVKTCNVQVKKGELVITEMKRLPCGKDWTWKLTPVSLVMIYEQGEKVEVSDMVCAYENVDIDESAINELFDEVKALKEKGSHKDMERILGRLEVLALNNNQKAKRMIKNIGRYIDFSLDGSVQEQWNAAIKTMIEVGRYE